jgi:hypothetical protein
VVTIAVGAVLVIVVGGALWARLTSTRAERRSLETYERTLDVLGDVARRSDAVADVKFPVPEDVARPHVRPNDPGQHPRPHPIQSSVRILPPRKADGAHEDRTADGAEVAVDAPTDPPTVLVPVSARQDPPTVLVPVVPLADLGGAGDPDGPAVAVDSSAEPDRGGGPTPRPAVVVFDADADADAGRRLRAGDRDVERNGRPRPERTIRRAATGAAAAVAIGALAVGGYQLASHKSGSTPSQSLPTHPTAAPPHVRHQRTAPSQTTTVPTAAPSTLEPSSTSPSVVTYQLHAPSYTVSFSVASGACWLGAQQLVGGPYVKMWTLAPGQQASYAASGPLVVKIGAPRYVTISVDGTPLALPAGRDQPYDVSLVPGSAATA